MSYADACIKREQNRIEWEQRMGALGVFSLIRQRGTTSMTDEEARSIGDAIIRSPEAEAYWRALLAEGLEAEMYRRYGRIYMDWETQTAYLVKVMPLKNEWEAAIAVVRSNKNKQEVQNG